MNATSCCFSGFDVTAAVEWPPQGFLTGRIASQQPGKALFWFIGRACEPRSSSDDDDDTAWAWLAGANVDILIVPMPSELPTKAASIELSCSLGWTNQTNRCYFDDNNNNFSSRPLYRFEVGQLKSNLSKRVNISRFLSRLVFSRFRTTTTAIVTTKTRTALLH